MPIVAFPNLLEAIEERKEDQRTLLLEFLRWLDRTGIYLAFHDGHGELLESGRAADASELIAEFMSRHD